MIYIIRTKEPEYKHILKKAETKEDAEKTVHCLSKVFDVEFYITEANDIWSVI